MEEMSLAKIREIIQNLAQKTTKGEIKWFLSREGSFVSSQVGNYRFQLTALYFDAPIAQNIEIPDLNISPNLRPRTLQRVIQLLALSGDEKVVLYVISALMPSLTNDLIALLDAVKESATKDTQAEVDKLYEMLKR